MSRPQRIAGSDHVRGSDNRRGLKSCEAALDAVGSYCWGAVADAVSLPLVGVPLSVWEAASTVPGESDVPLAAATVSEADAGDSALVGSEGGSVVVSEEASEEVSTGVLAGDESADSGSAVCVSCAFSCAAADAVTDGEVRSANALLI